MNKVLLVGNDINNITSDYSWSNLVDGLIEYGNLRGQVDRRDDKPFPHLYEEIYLNAIRKKTKNELEIKKYIASNTSKLKPNAIHRKLLDFPIDNILTTNYDYSLERCDNAQIKLKNAGVVKESKYSIFRHHEVQGKRIWHIHGSQGTPSSITLGYEHYGGYLQMMRNYVTAGTKTTYVHKEYAPIIRRLKRNQIDFDSWIDFFFTHDIIIIGYSLELVEIHLWWLLTYRSRLKLEKRYKGINITNNIIYFYPDNCSDPTKLDLLKANGIQSIPIGLYDKENRMPYYNSVIDEVAKLI